MKTKKPLKQEIREEASKMSGLVEVLESNNYSYCDGDCGGSESVVDVKVDESNQVATYILDSHSWSRHGGGVGMSNSVHGYSNGREYLLKEDYYRDDFNKSGDNFSIEWKTIKSLDVKGDVAYVTVISSRGNKSEKSFKLSN